jgi:hypothetical protein
MPENRNDKEAELNTLARLFAISYVSFVESVEAELPMVVKLDDGVEGDYVRELLRDIDVLILKLRAICKELGYAGQTK